MEDVPLDGKWELTWVTPKQVVGMLEDVEAEFYKMYDALPNKQKIFDDLMELDEDMAEDILGEERSMAPIETHWNSMDGD